MSESTISRNSFPVFGKPPIDYSKMTREEFEKAAGMKFMSYDEMINGNKPDSESGNASGKKPDSGSGKTSGLKFMSYDEMINGNKPDSETGRVSGGADASGSVAGVGFSAGAGASIKF